MCIAILKTRNGLISKDELLNCYASNPDMCGFAYVNDDKKITINKYSDFNLFYDDYNSIAKLNDRNILIHFRIATSGQIDEDNCHPFRVNDRMALIHNGVISGMGDKNRSDTREFIDTILNGIPYKQWKNPFFIRLVSEAIGNSKFVLLDTSDKYYIVNEDLGHWSEGVWFSNYSYTSTTKTNNIIYDYGDDEYELYINEKANEFYNNKTCREKVKCTKCGKEFSISYDDDKDGVCPICLCEEFDNIGWIYDGIEYIEGYA